VEGDAVRVAGEKTDRALGVRDAGGRDARRSEGSGPSAGAPVGDEELGVADKVKDRAQVRVWQVRVWLYRRLFEDTGTKVMLWPTGGLMLP
jgi:hypothetical protein